MNSKLAENETGVRFNIRVTEQPRNVTFRFKSFFLVNVENSFNLEINLAYYDFNKMM